VAQQVTAATIIIPTFNHAAFLKEAVYSALAQTCRCEVIVVDDGSTDGTAEMLALFGDRIRVVSITHGGPSAARNAGLAAASGEFVMFLDADDVIDPTKVERQLAAFSDDVGWVLCDVQIDDESRGRRRLASEQYRYGDRNLGGWIRDQLAVANFIPIMAPLIRRAVLTDDIRFSDHQPEDWHFLYRLAAHARVRYIPDVLATYRKRRDGRHHAGLPVTLPPAAAGPLLLNLGCGTPGSPSWHPMPGFVNLDRSLGWVFEDGLPQIATGSVAGISISHALMYVHEADWPALFAELARVLEPAGVVRITEDDTVHPKSSRRGGWRGSEPAVTMTSPAFVRYFLEEADFVAYDLNARSSMFRSGVLIQAQHGAPPDVFFIEGLRR